MNKIPNRKAICDVLLKEAETDKDIVVLCSDSRGSASLAPAIVWQCSRASEICERIKTNVMIDPDREKRRCGRDHPPEDRNASFPVFSGSEVCMASGECGGSKTGKKRQRSLPGNHRHLASV